MAKPLQPGASNNLKEMLGVQGFMAYADLVPVIIYSFKNTSLLLTGCLQSRS